MSHIQEQLASEFIDRYSYITEVLANVSTDIVGNFDTEVQTTVSKHRYDNIRIRSRIMNASIEPR